MNEMLPAESPIDGVFWTGIVPVALFALACVATRLLYRHFARRGDDP